MAGVGGDGIKDGDYEDLLWSVSGDSFVDGMELSTYLAEEANAVILEP